MVLANLCEACSRGDHDHCEGDKEIVSQLSFVCTCSICIQRREETDEVFQKAASRALYGIIDYDAFVDKCAEELAKLKYGRWTPVTLRNIMNRERGIRREFWEIAARDIINEAARIKGVGYRLQLRAATLPQHRHNQVGLL